MTRNGALVPDSLIVDTVLELEEHFGAVSSESQVIEGFWRHEGEIYRDELVRVFVDVMDTDENHQFFVDLKARLKERFQQLDIWMPTYPIDVI